MGRGDDGHDVGDDYQALVLAHRARGTDHSCCRDRGVGHAGFARGVEWDPVDAGNNPRDRGGWRGSRCPDHSHGVGLYVGAVLPGRHHRGGGFSLFVARYCGDSGHLWAVLGCGAGGEWPEKHDVYTKMGSKAGKLPKSAR